jgi:hypothetical protein
MVFAFGETLGLVEGRGVDAVEGVGVSPTVCPLSVESHVATLASMIATTLACRALAKTKPVACDRGRTIASISLQFLSKDQRGKRLRQCCQRELTGAGFIFKLAQTCRSEARGFMGECIGRASQTLEW